MRIGIIGGGQLGMYLVDAAHKLGHTTIVLDPSVDGPASQNSDEYICASYDDQKGLSQLATQCDVITYEFENVKADVIDYLKDNYKVSIPQGYKPLMISQHRIREKSSLNDVGIKTAKFMALHKESDFKLIENTMSYPYIVKTCSGGYDGKGQWFIHNDKELNDYKKEFNPDIEYIVEAMVDYECEVSIIAIRNKSGEIVLSEPIENIHEHAILHLSISPARVNDEIRCKAKDVAYRLMDRLEFVGIIAIEMFVGKDGEIYVNEIAPRPHNSGHLSMDAYECSQYENAILAITTGEIQEFNITHNAVMVNILGQHLKTATTNKLTDNATLYLYGKKESKINRKMGHITFVGDNLDEMMQQAEAAIK